MHLTKEKQNDFVCVCGGHVMLVTKHGAEVHLTKLQKKKIIIFIHCSEARSKLRLKKKWPG